MWVGSSIQFSSVQSLSHVRLFATPWTAACQVPLSITNSRSLLKLVSIGSVMTQPSHPLSSTSPPNLLATIFLLLQDFIILQLISVQLLSRVRLFVTPWTAACQASLSLTNSWSLPKLMSIESVITSNHLILCRCLLLLPSNFPSIRVFSNESVLPIRWPKY